MGGQAAIIMIIDFRAGRRRCDYRAHMSILFMARRIAASATRKQKEEPFRRRR